MRMLQWVAMVIACWSGAALADHQCAIYRVNFGATTVPGEPADATSGQAVCEAAAALYGAWDSGGADTQAEAGTYSGDGPGGASDSCVGSRTRLCGAGGGSCGSWTTTNWPVSFPSGTMACPHDPCEAFGGLPTEAGGAGSWVGENLCRTEDAAGNPISGAGCRVARAGPGINMSGGWFGAVKFTGESCGTSGDTEVDSNPPDCVTGPRGQVCLPKPEEGKSCGTFNGERLCFDKVPDSGCVLLNGGGAVCEAEVAPLDEEGEPLPPDAVVEDVQDGGTTNYNYYGPSTIGESSGGLPGSASSAETGNGERTPPEMDEEALDYGAEPDDKWDAAAGMGGAISGLGASSWFGVFSGSAAALSGSSSCPSVEMEIEFMDASFDLLEAACGYMAPHYSLWTTLMQVAWGLLALRIFFSGGRE